MQIRFHIVEQKIEIFVAFWFDYAGQFDDVFMVELVKDGYLSIGALRIDWVLEGIEYFFKGELFLGRPLLDMPNVPVGPTPEQLFNLKHLLYVFIDWFAHYYFKWSKWKNGIF